MTKRRILAVVVAAPIVVFALTGANGNVPGLSDLLGRGTSALALPDTATVTAGKSVRVDVLDNDTYRGARKTVTLRVASTPKPLIAKVYKQRVSITAPKSAKAGTYTVKYRLTDTRGSKSSAKVRVRVTTATTPPATPPATPTATPTPTASPTTSPTANPTTNPTATPTTTPNPTPAGTLLDRINTLPVATENHTGYDRALFKHWNSGLPTGSGGIAYCDTREEVLISESTVPATYSGTGCTVTAGSWYSYYDGTTWTNPSDLDIDHMVPLAEAWESGASGWTNARREAYANDQGDPRSLIAVTDNVNQSKGDRDPGEWMPLMERCRYLGEWVAVKHRWGLTADRAEIDSMLYSAKGCENVAIEVIPYTG